MTIYLYTKTHLKTGLKYFGKTTNSDYESYRGSGKYWTRHLKKHGSQQEYIKTEIVFSSNDEKAVEEFALSFSKQNNIVESKDWANLKLENGLDGGSTSSMYTDEMKTKMSQNRRGKVGIPSGWKHKDETKKHMSKKAKERCERLGAPKGAFVKGNVPANKGVSMSEDQKKILREKLKAQKRISCPHCNKCVTGGNYARWHGDNCKQKG